MLRPLEASPMSGRPSSEVAVLPSIRSSSKTVTSKAPMLPTLSGTVAEVKKKGRPSKAEKMKEKRAHASEAIRTLMDDDPRKADIHAYFEARVKELLAEV